MKKILGLLPLLLLVIIVGCGNDAQKYSDSAATSPTPLAAKERPHMDKEKAMDANEIVEEASTTPTTVDALEEYSDAEELLIEVDALLADIDAI